MPDLSAIFVLGEVPTANKTKSVLIELLLDNLTPVTLVKPKTSFTV